MFKYQSLPVAFSNEVTKLTKCENCGYSGKKIQKHQGFHTSVECPRCGYTWYQVKVSLD